MQRLETLLRRDDEVMQVARDARDAVALLDDLAPLKNKQEEIRRESRQTRDETIKEIKALRDDLKTSQDLLKTMDVEVMKVARDAVADTVVLRGEREALQAKVYQFKTN